MFYFQVTSSNIHDTLILTPDIVILTCNVVNWCHIDVMTATCLNHRPCDARQPTLRHRGVVVAVTITIGIRQALHLQNISEIAKK